MCYRLRCNTSSSLTVSFSDVRISINRTGSIQTAVLPGRFRYAVSYEDLVYKHTEANH